MTKAFFKYLFSLSLLLLVGSNVVYGHEINSTTTSPKSNVAFANSYGAEDLESSINSSSALPEKQQHIIGEEKVEEEEERTTSDENFLSTSFSITLSSRCLLVFPKEELSFYPDFSCEPSFKRYLRFEAFRL